MRPHEGVQRLCHILLELIPWPPHPPRGRSPLLDMLRYDFFNTLARADVFRLFLFARFSTCSPSRLHTAHPQKGSGGNAVWSCAFGDQPSRRWGKC